VPKTLFLHCYAPGSNAAEQSVCETSCFLTIFGKALDPTKLRIKLQERTLRCQLKVCSKGFKRSHYGSLHAYLPIDLAVETSQPQFLNKTTNLQKIITTNQQLSTNNLIWAYPSPSFSHRSGRAVRCNLFVFHPWAAKDDSTKTKRISTTIPYAASQKSTIPKNLEFHPKSKFSEILNKTNIAEFSLPQIKNLHHLPNQRKIIFADFEVYTEPVEVPLQT